MVHLTYITWFILYVQWLLVFDWFKMFYRSLTNQFLLNWWNQDRKLGHLTTLTMFLEVAKTGYSLFHHCFVGFIKLFMVLSIAVIAHISFFYRIPFLDHWWLKLSETAIHSQLECCFVFVEIAILLSLKCFWSLRSVVHLTWYVSFCMYSGFLYLFATNCFTGLWRTNSC